MSTLSGLFGGGGGASPPTTLFANICRLNGAEDPAVLATYHGLNSSALTTDGNYQNIVSVSGTGILNFLLVGVDGNVASDLDFKVLIDGVAVLTQEGVATTQNQCYSIVGTAAWEEQIRTGGSQALNNGSYWMALHNITLDSIPFTTGFTIQVKSASAAAISAQAVYRYYLTG